MASESDIPEGWTSVPIGRVFELNPPKPPKDALAQRTEVTFVPMPAVDADAGAITAPETRPLGKVRKGYTAFREGDVLFAKITPCMENGKAAIAQGLTNGLGFGSTEFHVLRPTGAVAAEYLYRYIRQESFRRMAKGEMRGQVGQQRVPPEFVEQYELAFPPLAEQRRITKMADKLLEWTDATRDRLDRVLAVLKRLRQSVLAAACSGRLTEPWREAHPGSETGQDLIRRAGEIRKRRYERECENAKAAGTKRPKRPKHFELRSVDTEGLPTIPDTWSWAYLPDWGFMGRGKSRHRPRNDPKLYGGPYPFIQTGDVAQSGGRITSHSQTYNDVGLAQSRLWSSGTICITIAANIANSAILTYEACFPDSVVGVIPDEEFCVGDYFEYFIRTAQADLSAYAPATAQKNINLQILSEVAAPLPPLAEQREIARLVHAPAAGGTVT